MRSGTLGRHGEDFAADFLVSEGYTVLARNYSSRYGEIDIVAAQGETIAFVEVKTRRAGSAVSGEEAVNRQKQRKIITTALLYMQEFDISLQPRFDVLSVISDKKGSLIDYHYIMGAFDGEAYG